MSVDLATEKKWEEIYKENSSILYGYLAKKIGHDQANDILQESFLRLLQTMKKNRKIDNAKAYLFQTARNLVSSEFNKNYLALSSDFPAEYEDRKSNTENDFLRKEINNLIETAKHSLTESELDIFELRWFLGFTQVEIAKVLSKSERQIRRDLDKMAHKIRSVFKKEGWDADDIGRVEL